MSARTSTPARFATRSTARSRRWPSGSRPGSTSRKRACRACRLHPAAPPEARAAAQVQCGCSDVLSQCVSRRRGRNGAGVHCAALATSCKAAPHAQDGVGGTCTAGAADACVSTVRSPDVGRARARAERRVRCAAQEKEWQAIHAQELRKDSERRTHSQAPHCARALSGRRSGVVARRCTSRGASCALRSADDHSASLPYHESIG